MGDISHYNRLCLNVNRSDVLWHGRPTPHLNMPSTAIFLQDKQILPELQVGETGMTFDSRPTLGPHVTNIIHPAIFNFLKSAPKKDTLASQGRFLGKPGQ